MFSINLFQPYGGSGSGNDNGSGGGGGYGWNLENPPAIGGGVAPHGGVHIGGGVQPTSNFIPPPPNRHPNEPPQGNNHEFVLHEKIIVLMAPSLELSLVLVRRHLVLVVIGVLVQKIYAAFL